MTVLIVTHDMELIDRCCTHILHLEKGWISFTNKSAPRSTPPL